MKVWRRLAPSLLVIAACACAGGRKPPPREAVQALQSSLGGGAPPFVGQDDEGAHLWKSMRRFYKGRGDQPAWLTGRRLRPEAVTLARVVGEAHGHGLEPGVYGLEGMAQRRLEPAEAAETELRLTHAFMKYASHMLAGRIDPHDLDPKWAGQARRADLPDLLDRALGTGRFEETLRSLPPRHEAYARLVQALRRLREVAHEGGWATDLPAALATRKGGRGPRVAMLRERLARGGDRPAAAPDSRDVYDDGLATALASFQRRHGLEADGLPDGETVAALNVSVEERIRQVEMNLERWRWLPEDLGARHVLVNIPTFALEAVEGGRVTLRMRVVAGTKADPTPIFSDQMTHIVFSPYWNIPRRIAREETIPALLRDPGYLYENGLEIVQGTRVVHPGEVDLADLDSEVRLRQRPGARNALGLVKFLFPNRHAVYLHDTPADSLFAREVRSFSHGCVRVEKPRELAEWVLRGQGEWTATRIEAAMRAGDERHVRLQRPVPVHLVYQTVWAGSDGALSYAEDIYGLDAAQRALAWPAGR
jgi:murein L,D-transpeptidase YcbB/YkuD